MAQPNATPASTVIGGILESCGVAGFLEDRAAVHGEFDAEGEEWLAFVEVWAEELGVEPVRAGDLAEMVLRYVLLNDLVARQHTVEFASRTRHGLARPIGQFSGAQPFGVAMDEEHLDRGARHHSLHLFMNTLRVPHPAWTSTSNRELGGRHSPGHMKHGNRSA